MKKYTIDGVTVSAESCRYQKYMSPYHIHDVDDVDGYKFSASGCSVWSWCDSETFLKIAKPVREYMTIQEAAKKLICGEAKVISCDHKDLSNNTYTFIDGNIVVNNQHADPRLRFYKAASELWYIVK